MERELNQVEFLEELKKLKTEDFQKVFTLLIELLEKEFAVVLNEEQVSKIERIIKICIDYDLKVPNVKENKDINGEKDLNIKLSLILKKWLKSFTGSLITPPSLREGSLLSEKDSVEDPAIRSILEALYDSNEYEVSEEIIQTYIQNHEILMAIENTQGRLLEEYIAQTICKKPYNFIWLDGEVVTATDFSYEDINNGEIISLQIKNKFNSENSSSNKIRKDTDIQKWNRIGKRTKNKVAYATFHWDELNEFVEELTQVNPEFSEEKYQNFLKQIIEKNPKIISLI